MSKFQSLLFAALLSAASLLSACGQPPQCGPQAGNVGCSQGYTCELNSGMCLPNGGAPQPQPDMMGGNPQPQCRINSDCAQDGSQVCESNICKTKPADARKDNGASCTADADCKSGYCGLNVPRVCTDRPNGGGNLPGDGTKVQVLDNNILLLQSTVPVEFHVEYLDVVNPAGKAENAMCTSNSECVSNQCQGSKCIALGKSSISGQSTTGHTVNLRKVDVCSPGYGFQVWVRVGKSVNSSMPPYGCTGGPSFRNAVLSNPPVLTFQWNGRVINAVGEFVRFPWSCNNEGDGNFYMGNANQLLCN